MQVFLLLGGILYVAVIGWYLMGRLGQSLDKGTLSPYWDESEEQAAKERAPIHADTTEGTNRCRKPDSNI